MKDELRKKLKIMRAHFCGTQRDRADEAILKYFLGRFGDRQSYFIYNSFSSEADTKGIIRALLSADRQIYLPRVEGENMVAVPYSRMRMGTFGIEEPEGQAYFGDIDITVIPLLAVNSQNYRIGYGRGYYDKYLQNMQTLKVGLGYYFQKADFYEDEWDVPLDAFVCEKGIF